MSDFEKIRGQLLHQLEVAGATADRLVDATPENPRGRGYLTAPVCIVYGIDHCSPREKAVIKSLRTRIKAMHKELNHYGLR